MIESVARTNELPFHKKKIVFVWSAMRHFAEELGELGYEVDYHRAAPDYTAPLKRHIARYRPTEIRLMETAEYGRAKRLGRRVESLGVDVRLTQNNSFISDSEDYSLWARGKKRLLMETFYRSMRRRTGILMDGANPEGGTWNYDRENRKVAPRDHVFPDALGFKPDLITQEVIASVESRPEGHFGRIDEFALPVTREQAEAAAQDFFDHRLDLFGPYQDAIVAGRQELYHSGLSILLNVGLLDPLALCREAESRYRQGRARISSVEGFIRQVLGWREFIYHLYHQEMPGYLEHNALDADLPLPAFYWDAETDMNCIADAVTALLETGSNHHIQRLMITGNFALLAGIDPKAVHNWYRLAYTDAYEWVVAPNVLGMALYADGGRFATKPYAASANYINKMSDCCRSCSYDPRKVETEDACPFNALYWDFFARNEKSLGNNPRISLVRRNWDRRDEDSRAAIRERAGVVRRRLAKGVRV